MKYSSKWLLFFHIAMGLSFGCGWEDDFDSKHILTDRLLGDAEWAAFLPEIPRYSHLSEEPMALPSMEDAIAAEWHAYKPSVPVAVWKSSLFRNGSTPALSEDEKAYMDFMREAEPLADQEWDWDYEGPTRELKDSMLAYAGKARERSEALRVNAFLSQRYIFQAMRLFRYADEFNSVEALGAATGWEKGAQTLTYWRMKSLLAGAKRHLKKDGEAMALFAEVADRSPELRYMGYANAKYIANWEAGLTAATDSASRAMLLFTKLVYMDETDPATLRALAETEQKPGRLEVAFLKQVAAYERIYWRPLLNHGSFVCADSSFRGEGLWEKMASGGGDIQEKRNLFQRIWDAVVRFVKRLFGKDEASAQELAAGGLPPAVSVLQCGGAGEANGEDYWKPEQDSNGTGKELLEFARDMYEDAKVANKALYAVGGAQLALMTGDYEKAVDMAGKVPGLAPANSEARNVAALLKALALLENKGVGDDEFMEEAGKLPLARLDSVARNLYFERLGKAYLKKGNFVDATAALLARTDKGGPGYAMLDLVLTLPELDSLEKARTQAKTPFQLALYAGLPDKQVFAELAGNKCMRLGLFDEAVRRFEKNGEGYWKAHEDGEMEGGLVHSTELASPVDFGSDLNAYDRLEFARKVRDLAKDGNYAGLMKLGNLFFWDWSWHYSGHLWGGYGLLDQVRELAQGSSELYGVPEASLEIFNRVQIFIGNYSAQQMAARFYAKAALVAPDEKAKGEALYAFVNAKRANWTSAGNADQDFAQPESLLGLLRDSVKDQALLDSFSARCSRFADFLAK